MQRVRLASCAMLLLSLASLAHAAYAQSAQPDLRRTPLPPPGHTVVPGEVPVQMPPPCAGAMVVHAFADTLQGLRRPVLIRFSYASPLMRGLWHADFIVGTTGVPEPESIELTRNGKPTDDERFRRVIEALRFQPASLNGCAVRFRSGMDLTAEAG